MTRPANLTPADIERFKRDFETGQGQEVEYAHALPDGLERHLAGCWLFGRLVELGAGEDLAERICFALGQKQAYIPIGGDVWAPAIEALRHWEEGHWLISELGLPETLRWLIHNRPEVALKSLRRVISEGAPKTPWEQVP